MRQIGAAGRARTKPGRYAKKRPPMRSVAPTQNQRKEVIKSAGFDARDEAEPAAGASSIRRTNGERRDRTEEAAPHTDKRSTSATIGKRISRPSSLRWRANTARPGNHLGRGENGPQRRCGRPCKSRRETPHGWAKNRLDFRKRARDANNSPRLSELRRPRRKRCERNETSRYLS